MGTVTRDIFKEPMKRSLKSMVLSRVIFLDLTGEIMAYIKNQRLEQYY